MIIDTHCHINFNDYKEDAEEVIKSSLRDGVWMILVGSEYKTSKRALDFANKYERGVYSAVGVHPVHLEEIRIKDKNGQYNFIARGEEFNYENYEKLAKFEKVVAIGEIGLDYYHINLNEDPEVKKKQRKIFVQQLDLARNLNLPVIIHCRQAHDDMLALLKEYREEYKNELLKDRPWGVMHCFSGTEDLAWQYFSLGLIISFTGIITFSKQWDDLLRKIPSQNFMVETDSPYLSPEPFRGERNEPALVKYVVDRIAQIRNTSFDKISRITTENARHFFNI